MVKKVGLPNNFCLDFEGFGDEHNDDNAPDVDVPLPEKETILDRLKDEGWKGDNMESYDKEAMKTMQDYQARKNEVSMTCLYLIYW